MLQQGLNIPDRRPLPPPIAREKSPGHKPVMREKVLKQKEIVGSRVKIENAQERKKREEKEQAAIETLTENLKKGMIRERIEENRESGVGVDIRYSSISNETQKEKRELIQETITQLEGEMKKNRKRQQELGWSWFLSSSSRGEMNVLTTRLKRFERQEKELKRILVVYSVSDVMGELNRNETEQKRIIQEKRLEKNKTITINNETTPDQGLIFHLLNGDMDVQEFGKILEQRGNEFAAKNIGKDLSARSTRKPEKETLSERKIIDEDGKISTSDSEAALLSFSVDELGTDKKINDDPYIRLITAARQNAERLKRAYDTFGFAIRSKTREQKAATKQAWQEAEAHLSDLRKKRAEYLTKKSK